MEIRPRVIRSELMECLGEIELQIAEIKRHANALGIEPYKIRDANGGWAMPQLLSAKASVLHGLVILNTKES